MTKDLVIPITDEELRQLPLPTAKAIEIEIETFVPMESIDPIRIGEGYNLAPSERVAAKPYRPLVPLRRSARQGPRPEYLPAMLRLRIHRPRQPRESRTVRMQES